MLKVITIPTLFIFLVLGLLIVILLSLNSKIEYREPKKEMQAYVPVLVDDHEVLLIRGTDTISLKLENAARLQEEYVIYVTQ